LQYFNIKPCITTTDFMDGFHVVDFEWPWFVEMIETDGAPVD